MDKVYVVVREHYKMTQCHDTLDNDRILLLTNMRISYCRNWWETGRHI